MYLVKGGCSGIGENRFYLCDLITDRLVFYNCFYMLEKSKILLPEFSNHPVFFRIIMVVKFDSRYYFFKNDTLYVCKKGSFNTLKY